VPTHRALAHIRKPPSTDTGTPGQPTEKTGLKPASVRMRFISSRLSPWISMHPFFTVPPTP